MFGFFFCFFLHKTGSLEHIIYLIMCFIDIKNSTHWLKILVCLYWDIITETFLHKEGIQPFVYKGPGRSESSNWMTKIQNITACSQFSWQRKYWHKQDYVKVFWLTVDYSALHAKVAEHALKCEYFKCSCWKIIQLLQFSLTKCYFWVN